MIEGWPLAIIELMLACGLTDANFRHLAGNSFEIGAVAATIISTIVHMPNRPDDEDGGDITLDQIADLFGIVPSVD